MYEHRSQPLLPSTLFLRRLLRHGLLGAVVIAFSLAIGILGYRFLAGFSWLNALLDANYRRLEYQLGEFPVYVPKIAPEAKPSEGGSDD